MLKDEGKRERTREREREREIQKFPFIKYNMKESFFLLIWFYIKMDTEFIIYFRQKEIDF